MKLGLRIPQDLPTRELALAGVGALLILAGIVTEKACAPTRAYVPASHEVRP